ncbi:MAG TPA: serine/threonine-protein kinase [Thermoanaerobaculia bacterium]|nr:serine/threonine-protein kinase [Thermoanaerobaculia bacterium]
MSVLQVSHYRLLQKLGSGSGGEVYLAEDVRLRRKVALKLVPNPTVECRERFLQEAHCASVINHPNVVSVFDVGTSDDYCYIATEFVQGETLRRRLRHGRLPVIDALEITQAVAEALAAAHELWIVHRDIKPENIMVRPDHRVKVLDFGVAKLSVGGEVVDPLLQRIEIAGTIGYLSPEQVRGDLVDNRSDLFSLGVVLYEMLVGRNPFEGSTTIDVLAGIVEKTILSLPEYISENLCHIVQNCLKKNAWERYQTASDLVADVRKLRDGFTMAGGGGVP